MVHDVRRVRIELEPWRTPAVHVHHDLHVAGGPDALRIGHHQAREAMHDEHLGRQLLVGDELVERPDDVVDVAGHHLADPAARARAFLVIVHVELGIHAEVHVGALEVCEQRGKLLLQRAVRRLDIQEQHALAALRPRIRLLDHRRILATAPHAVGAWRALRDDGHQVNGRHDWRRGIRGVPLANRAIQHAEHLRLGILTDHTHLLRVRIAVVRHDALARQQCTRRSSRAIRPARSACAASADRGVVRGLVARLATDGQPGHLALHGRDCGTVRRNPRCVGARGGTGGRCGIAVAASQRRAGSC